MSYIDPMREIEAYKDAVRCGFMTQREVVANQGGDLEETMASLSQEREMADSYQLVLDIDPAKVSNAGLTQARPEGTQIPID
jgi:capsid protein